ncbi:MAG: hypothetical protein NXI03_10865, partial [Alphaproteobacteria bacterium]|nr:hypothetical protein [Alphaproteobacteria bacterium]
MMPPRLREVRNPSRHEPEPVCNGQPLFRKHNQTPVSQTVMTKPQISVVVPAYNEAGNVVPLAREIA